jgi:hypothetical protein
MGNNLIIAALGLALCLPYLRAMPLPAWLSGLPTVIVPVVR